MATETQKGNNNNNLESHSQNRYLSNQSNVSASLSYNVTMWTITRPKAEFLRNPFDAF
jgi:hypothetical protein